MRSTLNLDCDCNPEKAPEYLKASIRWRDVRGVMVPYYPKGTAFEGEQAVFLCQTGQASPADEETAKAVNMPPEVAKAVALKYEMADKGILPDHHDLYAAGVMVGYNDDGTMKPGPNWAAYQEALDEEEDA